jgi:predicted dehydrogenase
MASASPAGPQGKRLRGGVVGCGMISEFHLRGWQRIPEIEIVALADPSATAAQDRQAKYAPQARLYPDINAMLAAEALDFVDIITPPWLHAEHCLAAKAANVHVICQKPLCLELDEAARLVDAMAGSSKIFAVHENHRFRPWFLEIRRRHAEGFFGKLRYVRIDQFDPYEPPEKFKADAARGVVLEYGTHLVDMARALLGEPRQVFARAHRPNPRVKGESLAHIVFDHAGDATCAIEVAWKAAGLQQGGFLVIGDKGEAILDGRLTRDAASRFRLVSGNDVVVDEARSPTTDYVDSFYLMERDVTDAMLAGRAPEQTGVENLRTLEATFASYQAMEEGRLVRIP